MGALYKKEVLIRPTSGVSIPAAVNWVQGWLNRFYTAEGNEDNYFADIFDPRGKHSRLIRVFHTGCKESYGLSDDELVYTVTGDVTDTGLDDGHLDVESGGVAEAFIISDSDEFKELVSEVDDLQIIHAEETPLTPDDVKLMIQDFHSDDTASELAGRIEVLEQTVKLQTETIESINTTMIEVMMALENSNTDRGDGGESLGP